MSASRIWCSGTRMPHRPDVWYGRIGCRYTCRPHELPSGGTQDLIRNKGNAPLFPSPSSWVGFDMRTTQGPRSGWLAGVVAAYVRLSEHVNGPIGSPGEHDLGTTLHWELLDA